MGLLIDEPLTENPADENLSASASKIATPIIDSAQLFKNGREVIIIHENTTYRLKKTRFGKLILNK